MDGMMPKPKIVIAVYNPIEYDGRVKRSCETLASHYEVKLYCLSGSTTFNCDQYEIIRHAHFNKIRSSLLRQLIFWFGFIYFVWKQKPQLVYAHDFFLALPGVLAAKLVGATSVYDAHELIIPEPSLKMSFRDAIFYFCEKVSIKHHQIVIAANKQRSQLMAEHYGLNILPVVVRNITKITYNNSIVSEVLEKYPELKKKSGDIHIVYMGDMNLSRGIGQIIDAIFLLPNNYKLILVGTGPDLAMIRAIAIASTSDKLRIIGNIPNNDIQDVISTGDLGVIVYSMIGLNNFYCSPNKIFEYTQAGLPVITTCQPPLKEMVEKYGIGVVVGCESALIQTSYADAIRLVASNLRQYRNQIPLFLQQHKLEAEQEILLNVIMPYLSTKDHKA